MNTTAKKVSAACALVFLAAAAAWGLLYGYAHHRVAAAVDRIAASMPGVSDVEVGRIRAGFFGGAVELGELLVRLDTGADPIRIDSVTIHDADDDHPIPRWMHLELRGVWIRPAVHLPAVAGVLPAGAVPEQVVFRAESVYRYRADTQQLDLQRLFVAGRQMGELEITGRFENIDLERIAQASDQPMELFSALVGVQIGDAVLTYRDRTLVRETVRLLAHRRGLTPERYARRLVQRIRLRAEGAPEGLVAQTLAPLQGFIADARRIRISVQPRPPVSVGWLLWVRDPERLIELLDLRIDA
jgi:hypothetical protein